MVSLSKTRAGGSVKLTDLLDEAEERAAKLIESKNPQLSAEEKAAIANTVAMAAVKYMNLSKHGDNGLCF